MQRRISAMQILELFCSYNDYNQKPCDDRKGDFLLHIQSGDLLPIFLGCDGINNLRNGTFYWEQLKCLKHQCPQLYKSLLNGGFVIKIKSGTFNSVGVDMALEQSNTDETGFFYIF